MHLVKACITLFDTADVYGVDGGIENWLERYMHTNNYVPRISLMF